MRTDKHPTSFQREGKGEKRTKQKSKAPKPRPGTVLSHKVTLGLDLRPSEDRTEKKKRRNR